VIEEIKKDVDSLQIEQFEKDNIIEKLFKIKEKLEI